MPSVTTQELVARAQATSDMRDNFVTPAQWMYWASQERLSLDLFLARSGWALPSVNLDITVTGTEGGNYPVAPGTGVMAIICVHQVKANRYRRLKYQDSISFLRQTPGTTAGAQGDAGFFRAQWVGDTLIMNLYPEPVAGELYRVSYIPHPARLTLDSSPATNYANSVVYPMGWEERIVLGMSRRALMKEESDTMAVDQEIAMWEKRIEEASWSRVLGEVPAVRNVDDVEYGWQDRAMWPPYPGQWFWA